PPGPPRRLRRGAEVPGRGREAGAAAGAPLPVPGQRLVPEGRQEGGRRRAPQGDRDRARQRALPREPEEPRVPARAARSGRQARAVSARRASVLLGAFVFLVYALGACRTIYVGDSGELVAA